MALKAKLTKDEFGALPEPVREHYTASGDTYVLQAEGLADAGKLAEFRSNNERLTKELNGLRDQLKTFDGVDPEEYRRFKATPPPKPTEIEAQITAAVEKATKPLREQLERESKEKLELKRAAEAKQFEDSVRDAAKKAGVQDDYLIDVVGRARHFGFTLTSDGVRAMKGELAVRDDKGDEVTLDRFLKDLPKGFFGVTAGSGPSNAPNGLQTVGGKKTLYDPDPVTFGRYADQIHKGEVVVIRTR